MRKSGAKDHKPSKHERKKGELKPPPPRRARIESNEKLKVFPQNQCIHHSRLDMSLASLPSRVFQNAIPLPWTDFKVESSYIFQLARTPNRKDQNKNRLDTTTKKEEEKKTEKWGRKISKINLPYMPVMGLWQSPRTKTLRSVDWSALLRNLYIGITRVWIREWQKTTRSFLLAVALLRRLSSFFNVNSSSMNTNYKAKPQSSPTFNQFNQFTHSLTLLD